ncbi:hypothetical protein MIND_00176400 [Mycena indigotica]|uniref:Uncharacterized protein n=1 Tax=Mycena indigotica TaxID=2126181 RepID=A0A8H6TF47_9AGAR|nr:uncharacterized protein MIND_00176400 [Mycena indigotica]KAF7316568.1 hypothetical protein MIND_00176400 [Mycena indigotica]
MATQTLPPPMPHPIRPPSYKELARCRHRRPLRAPRSSPRPNRQGASCCRHSKSCVAQRGHCGEKTALVRCTTAFSAAPPPDKEWTSPSAYSAILRVERDVSPFASHPAAATAAPAVRAAQQRTPSLQPRHAPRLRAARPHEEAGALVLLLSRAQDRVWAAGGRECGWSVQSVRQTQDCVYIPHCFSPGPAFAPEERRAGQTPQP